ncbi:MAG TPA: biopolymer transporter ExbD [Casimicrobiaceae bacterium]
MRRVRKPINQINVVPYIDVMLVLLVIFMVTAPLVSPGEIELPSVGSKLTVPVQPLEVTLGPGKTLSLYDQQTKITTPRMTREQLVVRILDKQKGGSEQPVVIKAEPSARYQDVIDIIDVLQRNGVRKVGLLARPAS